MGVEKTVGSGGIVEADETGRCWLAVRSAAASDAKKVCATKFIVKANWEKIGYKNFVLYM